MATTQSSMNSTELTPSKWRQVKTFSPWDYVVFCSLFAISSIVGLYFAFKDRKKKSSDDYLLGNRKMSALPVCLSLIASFTSAITVLGTPAEIYLYGTTFMWFFVAYVLSVTFTAEVFAPMFYKLGINSAYEYLELRFNRGVRICGTAVFSIQMCVYMGMVMYMPALALNKVTGLSLILSICGTAAVCTFYTTIGGLKAVIWTDVLQCLVMWGGFVAIIVRGAAYAGGFGNVFRIANHGGRIDFLRFDIDPRIRHSFFSVAIGGTFMWLSVYGVNHSMVQRYLSCRTLKQAKLALYLNAVGLMVGVGLAILTGLTMFAIYHNCDPLASGKVGKSDQLTPYLVMDILQDYPGIPGLFVASAYSGTLSTISSGINALSCTTLEDFVKPCKPDISDKWSLILSKIFVFFFGCLGLALAFLVSLFDQILTMALKMFGVIGGPLLGTFLLGLFSTRGNFIGAYCGLFGGLFLGLWLTVGSTSYPPTAEFTRIMPTSTDGCYAQNVTEAPFTQSTSEIPVEDNYPAIANNFYSLSYCHYSTVLVLGTWLIGYIASLMARFWVTEKTVDSNLLAFPKRMSCRRKRDFTPGSEKAETAT